MRMKTEQIGECLLEVSETWIRQVVISCDWKGPRRLCKGQCSIGHWDLELYCHHCKITS